MEEFKRKDYRLPPVLGKLLGTASFTVLQFFRQTKRFLAT
jgi:hypothetical protein